MLITVLIPLSAALCYAAMLGAASNSEQSATHDMLFVISLLEIIGNLVVSMIRKYKVVSFEGSHLAERLNLLTLIILGEGEPQPSPHGSHRCCLRRLNFFGLKGIIKLAKNVSTIEATIGWHEWSEFPLVLPLRSC
jgi:hypothetical protein